MADDDPAPDRSGRVGADGLCWQAKLDEGQACGAVGQGVDTLGVVFTADLQNAELGPEGSLSDEFRIDILPEAESLGITRLDLGTQVRHAFFGAEAQRIQRGADEIKVMVRYPKQDRHTTGSLDSMFIRTPSGDEVPFETPIRPLAIDRPQPRPGGSALP